MNHVSQRVYDQKCQHCGAPAYRRRQHTAYVDDEKNFSVLCDECQEENDKYWQSQWDEYYRECM